MTHVCVEDFEKEAYSLLEKNALDYYRSGAGEQLTLNLNREAFKRIRVRPRYLRDVTDIDMSCNVLGIDLKWPVGISPTAMQKMAHSDGEGANARAAGNAGSIFILSTLSTMSIEEVAAMAPNTNKWFQLYVYKDRSLTEKMVRRAEKANYKAIVLTIDAPVFGQRRSDIRNNFSLPSHLRLANFQNIQADGVRSYGEGISGINAYVASQFDASLTWKDIAWLVTITRLPIIVKGVLTHEDAILARDFGCAGIIVSNHGGRQIDTVPASIEALPEIVKSVGDDLVVMLDGGVRDGNDVFKALALGAKLVFVGRPALWGLACGGQKGVEDMLSVLRKDLEISLALSGCRTLSDISRDMVVSGFEAIAKGVIPENIGPWELRNDQRYLFDMVLAVNNGECDEYLASKSPGPVSTARWLTTASRLLRVYVSKESPSAELRNMVEFVVKVYAPFWFLVKSQPQAIHGSRHVFNYICWIRELSNAVQAIIRSAIENNAYYFHPENILLAMITDADPEIRNDGYEKIKTARQYPPAGLRVFKVSKRGVINFESKSYVSMIDWSQFKITEPPCVQFYPDSELTMFQFSENEVINIPEFLCHSQNTERFVRVVSESASAVTDEKRLGHIFAKLESRDQYKSLDSRQNLVK